MAALLKIKNFQFLVILAILGAGVIGLLFFSFSSQRSKEELKEVKTSLSNMKIFSSVFRDGELIPAKYTCDGENINPPLIIEEVPKGAKSLALVVDDPDAPMGTFVHWLVWNIDPEIAAIGENSVPEKAIEGTNDFEKRSYGGPCPPSGTHRYFFKLYALDTLINLGPSARKADLEEAMEGHILEKAELVGLYNRP